MPTILFSLDCPRGHQRIRPAEAIAVILTMARLYGWEVTPTRGSYKGVLESSFMAEGHGLTLDSGQLDVLQDLLQACGQESLVWVSSRGHGTLVYCDCSERSEHLGVWTEVVNGAPRPDSWTEDDQGRCFTFSATSAP